MLLQSITLVGLAIAAQAAPRLPPPTLNSTIPARGDDPKHDPVCKNNPSPGYPFWPTICDLRGNKHGKCLEKCVFTEPIVGFHDGFKTMKRNESCEDSGEVTAYYFERQEDWGRESCASSGHPDPEIRSFVNKWWMESTCKKTPRKGSKSQYAMWTETVCDEVNRACQQQ